MTATQVRVATRRVTVEEGSRRWTWHTYVAAFGALCLLIQGWVWIAWLRTGPEQITRFRDTSDGSYKLAIAYQVGALLLLMVLGGKVVRDCVRQRRITFDAQFCIASSATFWLDPLANFLLPTYTYSSQWVNLNDWLGQVPLVRNPDAGRLPEPMLFIPALYMVGWLMMAMAVGAVMRWALRRWPHWSAARAMGFGVAVAFLCDLALETPMFLFNLWSNQGAPRIGLFANSGTLYPITEMLIAIVCFTTLGSLRIFKNDKGETLVERGQQGSRRRKAWTTQLALIGIFNALWMIMAVAWTAGGLFSGEWREMKPWVSNAVCDSPGVENTRYGPCPGSPGWRLPMPGSLPGEKPKGEDRWLNGPSPCDGCPPVRFTPGAGSGASDR